MHRLGDVRLGSFVDTAEMSLKLTSDSRQAEEWSFLKWLLPFFPFPSGINAEDRESLEFTRAPSQARAGCSQPQTCNTE